MKAITIIQPSATLIVIGAKQIETRSWATDYRGPLAIHAAQGITQIGGKRGLRQLCQQRHYTSVLTAYLQQVQRNHEELLTIFSPAILPMGAIIAVCELHDIRPAHQIADAISQQELAFGDYSKGQYAWLLRNVQILPTSFYCPGHPTLWEWDKDQNEINKPNT